jgi:hypothetical protein
MSDNKMLYPSREHTTYHPRKVSPCHPCRQPRGIHPEESPHRFPITHVGNDEDVRSHLTEQSFMVTPNIFTTFTIYLPLFNAWNVAKDESNPIHDIRQRQDIIRPLFMMTGAVPSKVAKEFFPVLLLKALRLFKNDFLGNGEIAIFHDDQLPLPAIDIFQKLPNQRGQWPVGSFIHIDQQKTR